MRHALPPQAPASPDPESVRRTTRVLLSTALAAGLVACTLGPAQATVAPTTALAATVAATTTATPFASDRFDRTVTGGWGTATLGGAWSVGGTTAGYSVAAGTGKHSVPSGQTATSVLRSVARTDADVRVDLALDRPAGSGAGVYTSVVGRDVAGAGDYRARLVVTPSGTLELRVARGATTLRAVALPGVAYAAGATLTVRTQVTGTAPTTIRAKAWRTGTTEPSTWQVSATDSTAALQVAGGVALHTYQSGATRVVASWSGLTAAPSATTTTVAPAPTTSATTAPAYVVDRFDRSVSGGWGTTTVGGTWKSFASGAGYAVAPGGGRQTVANGQTAANHLGPLVTDADVRVDVALDRPSGTGAGVYSSVIARDIPGVGDYRSRVVVTTSGGVELRVAKGSTTLRSTTDTGVTYAPGVRLSVRTQVTGTAPTTLRAKVWRAGTVEPATWQLSTTDATTTLQAPGRLTLSTFATGNATPVTATYSALEAAPSVPLPANVAPTASFAATPTHLAVALDATGSTDTDGSIVSYAWSHGDGTTSTGATTTHTYRSAGTYPTTLTVTDDRGATATTTRSVTVTAPPVVVPARDPWLHPFGSASVWNTAIGSGARFEAATGTRTASLFTAKPVINRSEWSVSTARATAADPVATLTAVRNKTTFRIHIPRGTVPTGGLDKHVTVVQPDGVTAYDLYKATRVSDTQWTAEYVVVVDLRETGIFKGVRAAGTPGFAGLIRKHEVANKHIPHALAIAVPGTVLKSGFVWPANRQDGDAATSYTGQVPMGSLFAIPSGVDVERMALSPEGKALARALQNYGAYVVDRSGMASLYCELSCDSTATERMKTDFKLLFPHLRAVSNSTATTVGGGGTPRVAPAVGF